MEEQDRQGRIARPIGTWGTSHETGHNGATARNGDEGHPMDPTQQYRLTDPATRSGLQNLVTQLLTKAIDVSYAIGRLQQFTAAHPTGSRQAHTAIADAVRILAATRTALISNADTLTARLDELRR
ncbi:hypothetical protein [Actinoplanes sp. NPDC026670]|uniref:hypothetical protein n=1 Tax=Actinoplanes sp. NPDC026670 TaxID=3154700 RepID=UPI00340BEFF0